MLLYHFNYLSFLLSSLTPSLHLPAFSFLLFRSFPLLPFYSHPPSYHLPPPPPPDLFSTSDSLADSWEWTEINQMTNFLSLNIQFILKSFTVELIISVLLIL